MTNETPRITKADQVRAHLTDMIDAGLAAHDRLPTERELADDLGVSRLTVRRALDRLEQTGAIYRVQGAGTFVSEPVITKSIELTSFSEDMRARGLRPGSQSSTTERVAAGPRVGDALGLDATSIVVHLQRVRTADDSPMCLEHSYLDADLVPGLADPLGGDSLYAILESEFSIAPERADQTIKATVLDPSTAQLLGVPPYSPALLVTRTAYDVRGRAIEYAESLYRADRYSYEISVTRRTSKDD